MLQLVQAASSAFHVVVLLIGLSGQPIGVGMSQQTWPDKAACTAGLAAEVMRVQSVFDSSQNPAVKGQIAVADAKCMSDDEIKSAKQGDDGSI